MIILMPSGRATDIRILQDHLSKSLDNVNDENLLDIIDREMTDPLANANEITLTIPEFKVAGDIDANEVLRKVRVEPLVSRRENIFDRQYLDPAVRIWPIRLSLFEYN